MQFPAQGRSIDVHLVPIALGSTLRILLEKVIPQRGQLSPMPHIPIVSLLLRVQRYQVQVDVGRADECACIALCTRLVEMNLIPPVQQTPLARPGRVDVSDERSAPNGQTSVVGERLWF